MLFLEGRNFKMFDKSDDNIKSLRNLTFNNDYIENQFEKNNNENSY